MVATDGWRLGCLVMRRSNRSKRTSGSWGPEASWRSKTIGFWFGSTNARTTPSSEKPRSIGTARRSHGWEDCAWRSSILDPSDKSNIVMGFLSAEIGVEGHGGDPRDEVAEPASGERPGEGV